MCVSGWGVMWNEKGGGSERFEREFLPLVVSNWAGGSLEHNELNEMLNQLTNRWPTF